MLASEEEICSMEFIS